MEALINFKLSDFEGPIDLLLNLIEKQKMDINEIALSEITEQYLDFVEALEEEKDAEDIANFLVVASRLLFLKSKTILPGLVDEEEQGPSLEGQLKIYRIFVDASKKLEELWQSPLRSFGKKGEIIFGKSEKKPENLDKVLLKNIILKFIRLNEPPKPMPAAKIQQIVSLKQKIKTLREILKNKIKVKFSDFFSFERERHDVVVTFLAILELAKWQKINIKQETVFGDIFVLRKK